MYFIDDYTRRKWADCDSTARTLRSAVDLAAGQLGRPQARKEIRTPGRDKARYQRSSPGTDVSVEFGGNGYSKNVPHSNPSKA
jgi:hypothetical protein